MLVIVFYVEMFFAGKETKASREERPTRLIIGNMERLNKIVIIIITPTPKY